MDKSLKPQGYAALITGTLVIGTSAIWMKSASVPGPVSSFYRMSLGALVLTIPFLRNLRNNPIEKKYVLLAILAGMVFGIDIAAWSTGVMLSGATVPTLMSNVAPVWVGILTRFCVN